jgi:hypothetical protein
VGPRAGDGALASFGIEPRSQCYILKRLSTAFFTLLLPAHYILHARGIWWWKREIQRSIIVIVIRDDNTADSCATGQRSHDDHIVAVTCFLS